jgi:hypothetical protein
MTFLSNSHSNVGSDIYFLRFLILARFFGKQLIPKGILLGLGHGKVVPVSQPFEKFIVERWLVAAAFLTQYTPPIIFG